MVLFCPLTLKWVENVDQRTLERVSTFGQIHSLLFRLNYLMTCTYRASGAGYGCVHFLRLDFLFSKCLKLLYFGTLLQNFIWQTFSIGSEGVIFVKICSSKDSWGQQWGPDSYWLGSWCTSLFSVHTHKIVCLSLFGSSSLWQPAHCMWWVLRYAAFFH